MTVRKAVGVGLLALVALAAVAITATIGWRPFIGARVRPLTGRRFEPTPQRLERGRYLATTAAVGCIGCHSQLAVTAGRLEVVAPFVGRSWTADGMAFLSAPNLTPDRETGIGGWSDDTLARAIREGIGHDGRTLFPIMPYQRLRALTDEDLASVVVYLRALAPVRNPLPASAVPFPVDRLINGLPQPIDAAVTADMSTPEKRGEYLVTIATCADCHTPIDDHGTPVPGMDFAGGFTPTFGSLPKAAAANITPAVNGIPYYTPDLFVEVLRTGRVKARELSDMMPTHFYRGMTDEDLLAIFAYLKTLKPIDHYVDNALPPTPCARCGLAHGGGARNKKTG
jgi:mono/diheme cytochrome c family protein